MMSLDVIELLDALKWDKAHVVGISLGGMIAQKVAVNAPSRVLSLGLIATTAGARRANDGMAVPLPLFEAQHNEINFRFTTNLLFPQAWLTASPDPTFPFSIAYADPKSPPDSATNRDVQRCWWIARREPYPSQTLLGWRKQWAAARKHYVSNEELAGIGRAGIKAVVIVGDADSVIPPSNSDVLSCTIPGTLRSFPGGGHGIVSQFPLEVNDALETLWLGVERDRKEQKQDRGWETRSNEYVGVVGGMVVPKQDDSKGTGHILDTEFQKSVPDLHLGSSSLNDPDSYCIGDGLD
ncbi:hypothetical protein HDU93_004735, partial [Gonapodya sp. JEL0774]